ncbi:MAG: glycosyltransferase family 4 protein [Syntrophotaleaceae bacterium]
MDRIPDLAILGSYPPPFGGVTIHTRRLCKLLDERRIDYIVFNAASDAENGKRIFSVFRHRRRWLLRYALFGDHPVVYIMSPRLMSWLLGAFLDRVRGKKVILRIQNSRLIDWNGNFLLTSLSRFSLCRVSEIIAVNREIGRKLVDLGVDEGKVHVLPGFLPPVSQDLEEEKIRPEIRQFLEHRRPVIAANGKISFYRNTDLYGLDQLVDLAIELKPAFPDLGIIFCFSEFSEKDRDYLDGLSARAAANGVSGNIFFNLEGGPFLPVLAKSDLFLRPTTTDGDANSIREALYLGVPIIASDAVGRPRGVTLFESRNFSALLETVRSCLSNGGKATRRAASVDDETRDTVEQYLELLCRNAKPLPISNPIYSYQPGRDGYGKDGIEKNQ